MTDNYGDHQPEPADISVESTAGDNAPLDTQAEQDREVEAHSDIDHGDDKPWCIACAEM